LYSTKGVITAIYIWLLKLNAIWYEALFNCMMLKYHTPQKLWHVLASLATEGNLYSISCNLQSNKTVSFFWNKDGYAWVITRSVLNNSFLYEIVNITAKSSSSWKWLTGMWSERRHILAFYCSRVLTKQGTKFLGKIWNNLLLIAHIHHQRLCHLWLQTQEFENQVDKTSQTSIFFQLPP
jgi:hypothetical protein